MNGKNVYQRCPFEESVGYKLSLQGNLKTHPHPLSFVYMHVFTNVLVKIQKKTLTKEKKIHERKDSLVYK
jgi:hypothetical protein